MGERRASAYQERPKSTTFCIRSRRACMVSISSCRGGSSALAAKEALALVWLRVCLFGFGLGFPALWHRCEERTWLEQLGQHIRTLTALCIAKEARAYADESDLTAKLESPYMRRKTV